MSAVFADATKRDLARHASSNWSGPTAAVRVTEEMSPLSGAPSMALELTVRTPGEGDALTDMSVFAQHLRAALVRQFDDVGAVRVRVVPMMSALMGIGGGGTRRRARGHRSSWFDGAASG